MEKRFGTVGEPTSYSCANRQLACECAFIERGSSVRIRNHTLQPFGAKVREYQTG